MKRIQVLDCTLRDGGYCNQWRFGQENIRHIINGLLMANIDYIECGYLTDQAEYDADKTIFTNVKQLESILPNAKTGVPFLAMVNYGECAIENMPDCKETNIDGIRVAFHKKDYHEAVDFCRELKRKGYMLFIQPMVSMSYSEDEFLDLIHEVNRLEPYGFYIVDSFGMMKHDELAGLVNLTEKNLLENIVLGFHAHNNLQLAYSNAQYLTNLPLSRSIIIDVSVHGMGRGAGNLNAELFLDYLNQAVNTEYAVRPVLNLMDEIISRFYEEKPWGYSLPNYLSATHMIHPNYARYLDEKKTLTLEAIDDIFNMIDPEKGLEYDESYIEELYVDYMSRIRLDISSIQKLSDIVRNRKVLLIAPGKSVMIQKDRVIRFAKKEKPVIISINHDYPYLESDYIFVSNMRRFKQLSKHVYKKTIVTSNIRSQDTYATVDYFSFLNVVDGVRDNAGLMAIKFVTELGVTDVYLSGYDGFSHDVYENFETHDMALLSSSESMEILNEGIRRVLEMYSEECNLYFLTDSRVEPG